MAEPTLYLFDGYNLLHAGPFDDPRELVDRLASFVALSGARGVVVFDGVGEERVHGPLEVRYAEHADALLERLAAEHRGREPSASSPRTRRSAAPPGRRCRSAARERSCRTSTSRATRTRVDRSYGIAWTKRRENA